MSEEDMYIKAIRFAYSQKTFTLSQLLDHLNVHGEERTRLSKLFCVHVDNNDLFFYPHPLFEGQQRGWENAVTQGRDEPEPMLALSANDRFRLMEHDELMEARASSRSATYWAAAALFVSTLALLINTYFSYIGANP